MLKRYNEENEEASKQWLKEAETGNLDGMKIILEGSEKG